jgi:hypothetical protein
LQSRGAEYHYPRSARNALLDAARAAPVVRAATPESVNVLEAVLEAVWWNESMTLFHIVAKL